MLTKEQAHAIAEDWVQAWNSHDLDMILFHYAEDIILISPVAARLLDDPVGIVSGQTSLRNYFQKGLKAYPDLKFEILDVMWGISSIVVYYVNQNGSKTGEFMEIDSTGKITKVVANYSSTI
jgi:hypothetical protein